jgi:hypothetical protein
MTGDHAMGTEDRHPEDINSSSSDFGTCTSVDGLELYFSSDRPGGSGGADLWVSARPSTKEPWGPSASLGPTVNSPYGDCYPSLSADGLTLYFSGDYSSTPRPGGLGGADIWMTTRVSRSAPWGAPVNLGAPVNSSERDFSPTISGDGLTLVFTSTRSGGLGNYDLCGVPILPIVDLNGSGAVDTGDLLRLIESWGEDDPLCDIGPGPWGDGKVDIEDLKVFMTYYEMENPPKSQGGK